MEVKKMTSKILIGKGTLQEFSEDYEKTADANKGRMWSQLYPTGQARGNANETHMLYEWVIGYESDVFIKKSTPVEEKKPEEPKKDRPKLVI